MTNQIRTGPGHRPPARADAGRAPLFLCRAGWHAGQAGLRRACAARAPRGGPVSSGTGRARPLKNPGKKLRPISQLFDCPPIDQDMRRFVDWVASYTLSPPGMVARMVLRVPAAFDPEPPLQGSGSCPASRIASPMRAAA